MMEITTETDVSDIDCIHCHPPGKIHIEFLKMKYILEGEHHIIKSYFRYRNPEINAETIGIISNVASGYYKNDYNKR